MTPYCPPKASARRVFSIYLAILVATVVIAVNQVNLHDWGFLSWVLLAAIGLSVLIAVYGVITGQVWSLREVWSPERVERTRWGAKTSLIVFGIVAVIQIVSGLLGSWDVEETLVTGIFVGLMVYMAGMYAWTGQAIQQYRRASA
jgi:hypothetical protein